MGDEDLIGQLEKLLATSGSAPLSLTFDRELTAGANRRTVRLVAAPVDGRGSAFGVVAQITERHENGPAATRSVVDEGAVVTAAGSGGVPVAEVLVAGRLPGADPVEVLLTREVEGETIPRRVLRTVAEMDGGGELTRSCGRALARLHAMDPDSVPVAEEPLPEFTAENYLDHLTERLDDLPEPHPVLRFAIDRLGRRFPSDPPAPVVVHGDFRTGNLIVADTTLAAALDWELVHVGDPMEDLAWLCLRTWRFGADEREVGGFGSLDDLRDAYVEAGGRWRSDAFDWWTIARTIWWGIGLAGQAAAFCDGRSDSLVHAASGRRVVELEYDLLTLLAPLVGSSEPSVTTDRGQT